MLVTRATYARIPPAPPHLGITPDMRAPLRQVNEYMRCPCCPAPLPLVHEYSGYWRCPHTMRMFHTTEIVTP